VRPVFDKLFYLGSAGVGLSGVLYALYFTLTCVSAAVNAGWSTFCVAACALVGALLGTALDLVARRRGVRCAAGIGYGVSKGSAMMIFLIQYGTGLTWPWHLGTQLLLGAPPVCLMLGCDDRFLRLIEGPSQLLLPAPTGSGMDLVVYMGLSLTTSAGFSSTPNALFTLLAVVVCALAAADWNPSLMVCALLGAALSFGAQFTGFGWAGAMGVIFFYARIAVAALLLLRWLRLISAEGVYRWVIVDVHFPAVRLNWLDEEGNPSSWRSLVDRKYSGFDLEPRLFLRPLVLLTCAKYFRSYLLDPMRIAIKESRSKASKNAVKGLTSGIYGLLFHDQLDLAALARNFLFWDLKHNHLLCTMTTPLKDFMIELLTHLRVARALLGPGGGLLEVRPDLGRLEALPKADFDALGDDKNPLLTNEVLDAPLPLTTGLGFTTMRGSLTGFLEKKEFRSSMTVQKSYPSTI